MTLMVTDYWVIFTLSGNLTVLSIFFKRKVQLAGVCIAQSAIEFVVFACLPFDAALCTCVVPSGICLSKFFENTRDGGYFNQTASPRAFQKISDSNAQWFPLGRWLDDVWKTLEVNTLLASGLL